MFCLLHKNNSFVVGFTPTQARLRDTMQKPRFFLIFLLFSALCSLPCHGHLPAEISKLLAERNLPIDAIGAMVVRLSDGKVIVTHGAEKALQPASTLKVLTAIVGLERLGPAYRGRTELRSAAPLEGGVLKGDLVLRGLGNTDFGWEEFQRMLQSLRHQGVTTIAGNLIVDRGFFQPARIDIGVPAFDEAPEFRYNVIPDALLINTNLAQFDIASDDVGFQIRLTPALEGVSVISNMSFAERACEKWEDGWRIPTTVKADNGDIRVYLNGSFPKNCAQSLNLNVIDRTDYTERLFRATWKKLGGSFTGKVFEAFLPETAQPAGTLPKLLAEHRARPLAEVTRNINKTSDNTITRMLLLTLGTLDATAPGTTLQKGEAEIRAWLKQKGINDTALVLDNGSGLSRSERITPMQLAAVLQAGYRSKWAPEFLSSLPIVGVDGSMRNRLKTSSAAETGRIKTGSLRDVVAVAGYMPDTNGEQHAVVAMINHPQAIANGGRVVLDALLDWVAKLGR